MDSKLPWIESYVEQSLTFTSWKKVESKMCMVLKQNLEKKLMDPVNRQILFQILGNDFVDKHFSSYTSSPAILDNIQKSEREKKTAEMKTLMSNIIENAVQKKGPKSDNKIPSDLATFNQDLKNLIDIDFQEQLVETKAKKAKELDMREKYLVDMLSYDPSLVFHLLPKMRDDLVVLSDALRLAFWPTCILSKEKSKNKKNFEKNKEKFIQLHAKIESSDSDTDIDTISSVVSKTYKESKTLKCLDSEEIIQNTALILGLCDLYGKKFMPQYVYCATVFQQVYLHNKKKLIDADFGMAALMLEKCLRLCILSKEQLNKTVNKVLQMLSEADNELAVHIKEKLSENATDGTYLGNEPAPYLQKWLSDVFGSVLKINSLLFVWDQLFFNMWENKTYQDICLALMGLLKPWFMRAKNKGDVHKVFLEEPGLLYLLDLRKALGHVQRKGLFSDIPPMNRNIQFGKVVKPPTTPPKIASPPPKPLTPPKPKPPPPSIFIPWVAHNKDTSKKQTRNKVDQPFDLYIDSIRFVPDNASVVKLTGKVLNMYLGQKEKSIKFQAFPELDACWRYPSFRLKQVVNQESLPMNPDVVIMIRAYTVEQHSKKICVLGSCLFGPFSNKQGQQASLRVGGHQLRIRHGIPDPDFTVEHMLASHMDDNPILPGVTLLLRVLPHQKDNVLAPEYEDGSYRSELAKPNDSEKRLHKHYQSSKDLTQTVRDAALLLTGQASASDAVLLQSIQQQLQKEGLDVEDFPYQRYIRYEKENGIMILADKASGLPIFLEGRYLQCLVQVFPGEDTKMGNGKSQVISFVTEELELDSPQRAPDWSDQPKKVTPDYDDRAFIFVTLYGLRPKFDPSSGKVSDKEGKEPKFQLQHAIAWSAVTCFDKGAVHAGVHQIPLLKGRPPDDIIEKLSYLPLDYICKKFKNEVKIFDAASIEISIWDGCFSNNECPPLPTHNNLLNISSRPAKYIHASEHRTGSTAADLLKQGLPNPSELSKHKSQIVQHLKTIFKSNLDTSLSKAGYSPTI